MTGENEKNNLNAAPEEKEQVITPYMGKETVDRRMTGLMQEMRQATERTGRCGIKGKTDMMRGMGCDDEEILDTLIKEHGLSREEAKSYL